MQLKEPEIQQPTVSVIPERLRCVSINDKDDYKQTWDTAPACCPEHPEYNFVAPQPTALIVDETELRDCFDLKWR